MQEKLLPAQSDSSSQFSSLISFFYESTLVNITLDSGATTSFVTEKLCKAMKIQIQPNGQLARLGDGCTTIASKGEIDETFTRGKWSPRFRAIVVQEIKHCYIWRYDFSSGQCYHYEA